MNRRLFTDMHIAGFLLVALAFGCGPRDQSGNLPGTPPGRQDMEVEALRAMANDAKFSSADVLSKFAQLSKDQMQLLRAGPATGASKFLLDIAQRPMDDQIVQIFAKYFANFNTPTDGQLALTLAGDGQPSVVDAVLFPTASRTSDDPVAKRDFMVLLCKNVPSYPIKTLLVADSLFLSHLLAELTPAEAAVAIKTIPNADLNDIVKFLVLLDPDYVVCISKLYQLADLDTQKRFWNALPKAYVDYKASVGDAFTIDNSRLLFGIPPVMP